MRNEAMRNEATNAGGIGKEEWLAVMALLDAMTDDEGKAYKVPAHVNIMVQSVPDESLPADTFYIQFRVVVRGFEGAWCDSLLEALNGTRERVLHHARSSLTACEKTKRRHEEQIRKLTGET